MYILIVVMLVTSNNSAHNVSMQEFSSKEACQAAGTKVWELTGREAKWSCVSK